MANNQEMKAAKNTVSMAGIVKEHKLEKVNTEKGEVIKGYLTLKAGDFREPRINVYVNKMTKGDTPKVSENYKILEKFITGELQTLATAASEEEATKIKIWGNDGFAPQFRENVFASKNNDDEYETKTSVGVSLGFGNIKVDNTLKEEDFHAKFDLVMYVTKDPEEEIENNMKTERCTLQGVIPCYDGTAFPITVVAGILPPDKDNPDEYDFAADILGYVSKGQTLNVWGDIDFLHLIETVKKGGKMGRAKTETVESYVNELVIVGADEVAIDDSYTEEQIKAALEEREIALQNAITRAEQRDNEASNKPRQRGLSRINKREIRGEANTKAEDVQEEQQESTDESQEEVQQVPRRTRIQRKF